MTLPGYEADDILGTLAKKNAANGVEVSVVSETGIYCSLRILTLRSDSEDQPWWNGNP